MIFVEILVNDLSNIRLNNIHNTKCSNVKFQYNKSISVLWKLSHVVNHYMKSDNNWRWTSINILKQAYSNEEVCLCNNFASIIFNTLTNNLTYATLDSTIIVKYYAILFDALAPSILHQLYKQEKQSILYFKSHVKLV